MGGVGLDGMRAVPLGRARVSGGFWAERQAVVASATLPHIYEECRRTGRLEAFRLTWRPGQQPRPHYFWDSDVAKWVEAASYAVGTHADPALAARLEEVVDLVVGAQQPDGYLNTYFTVVEPEGRWRDLRDAHELYCAGHILEAAVAHHEATGSPRLLGAARRLADHIGRVFGRGPGQIRGYCGHEEIELALVRLWEATGEDRYLDLARYFVDERGREPYFFDEEARRRGGPGHAEGFMRGLRDARRYNQSHQPVREQREAVGHAVRALYLYSAMADLARIDADPGLREAVRALWDDVTGRHLYITGGVGSSAANEGFTEDWDLPDAEAYAETCAAVALVGWAHRMWHLEPDRRYADVLERALYNGALAGLSLDGRAFFYVNPLASHGEHRRAPWFDCACCPPNVARLVAGVARLAWSAGPDAVAVHLYVAGEVRIPLDGVEVVLRQDTAYPWDGAVRIAVEAPRPVPFALALRIPGWCRRPEVVVAGEPAAVEPEATGGYAVLRRVWAPGDAVELHLPMPVEAVRADPRVASAFGRVALARGPLVYALEGVDQPGVPLHRTYLDPRGPWDAAPAPAGLPPEIVSLVGPGWVPEPWPDGALYGAVPPPARRVALRAVPYYAWNHRGPGDMRVWMPEA